MHHAPLAGIRVLEFGGYISAPYATSILCALGAEVVKVERPGTGDDYRRGQGERSPYFRQYNAGKLSLGVNLKDEAGVALVKELIPRFDVVVENLRPGKLDAVGLGADACLALRPDLVYMSLTGFGSGGPLAQRPAYDTIGQAYGGLYSVLSDAGAPRLSGTCLADLITGITCVTGVLAGLVGRSTTKLGQRVETSLYEAVSTLTIDSLTQFFEDGHSDPTRQSRHPQAQNFVFKTASGDDIAVHLSSSQKFWVSLTEALGRPDLVDDSRFATYFDRADNYFELSAVLEQEFKTRPASEWEKLLIEADVPFAPVLGMSGYVEHPQTEWLELLEPKRDDISLLRPPWRFGGTRPERAGAAPKVGEHTRQIASEVYDAQTVSDLLKAGILFEEPR